jgi:hypothetical protein
LQNTPYRTIPGEGEVIIIRIESMAARRVDVQSDNVGIVSSVLCLLHCVSVPVLLSVATHWDADMKRLLNTEWIHYAFLAIALAAVYFSTRHAAAPRLRSALWIFFVVFGVGIVLNESFPAAKAMVYVGSLGLVISHVFNIRDRKPRGQEARKKMMISR